MVGGAHFPLADAAERTARTISNSCDVGCVITITAIRTRPAVGVGVDLYLYCDLCRDDLGDADDQKGFVKHWRGSKDFVKTECKAAYALKALAGMPMSSSKIPACAMCL